MFSTSATSDPFTILISASDLDDWFQAFPNGIPNGSVTKLDVTMTRSVSQNAETKPDRLRAPEVVFPLDGVELSEFPRITRLRWSPVPGAISYALDIEACQGFISREKGCVNAVPLQSPSFAPTSGIESTGYEFLFIGNQPGRWRIWAVDSEGRPGIKSSWMTFFYLL
jgi:hypothetical protein